MNGKMSIREFIFRALKASAGLILFGFGVYLTVQADIGLAPWDVFRQGISNHTPFTFGQVSIVTGFIILGIDICLKEKIGVGSILDAYLVGTAYDFFDKMGILDKSENIVYSLILITIGMFIMAYAQYLYMCAALCCGPNDSLLVALGKRMPKVPIGFVNIGIMAIVLVIGIFLGGPVGIGTVYSVAGIGVVQQLVFNLLHFEPRETVHVGIIDMIKK